MNGQSKIPTEVSDQAYASLPDWERILIDRQEARLMVIPRVGLAAAREILAHLGALMEESG